LLGATDIWVETHPRVLLAADLALVGLACWGALDTMSALVYLVAIVWTCQFLLRLARRRRRTLHGTSGR